MTFIVHSRNKNLLLIDFDLIIKFGKVKKNGNGYRLFDSRTNSFIMRLDKIQYEELKELIHIEKLRCKDDREKEE